jgi:hypothetical protein
MVDQYLLQNPEKIKYQYIPKQPLIAFFNDRLCLQVSLEYLIPFSNAVFGNIEHHWDLIKTDSETVKRLLSAFFCSPLLSLVFPFDFIMTNAHENIKNQFIDEMIIHRQKVLPWIYKKSFGSRSLAEILLFHGSDRNISLIINHFKPCLNSANGLSPFLAYSETHMTHSNMRDIDIISLMLDEGGLRLDWPIIFGRPETVIEYVCKTYRDIEVIKLMIMRYMEEIYPKSMFRRFIFNLRIRFIRNRLKNLIWINELISDINRQYLIDYVDQREDNKINEINKYISL